jgi:PAT family beta-lactamase induction signal transducer AmpG
MDSNWLKLSCLFILYFIQAMPYGFQSRYLPLVMRQSGLSLTSLGLYKLLLLPWVCKFFISAFIVDTYKTKHFWLMKSMQLLVIGSFLGAVFSQPDQMPMILFVLNWASACQDICVDWFAINILKEEDLGLGNTIQVAAFKLGNVEV